MTGISAFTGNRFSMGMSASAKWQAAIRFGGETPSENPPLLSGMRSQKGQKADPWAAAFVLAFLTAAVGGIFFGPAIKDKFFPGKNNAPPAATQKLEQNPFQQAR